MLRSVGALQVTVVDTAITEFEIFTQLFEKADLLWQRGSKAEVHQVLKAIPPCEDAMLLSHDWVQKYKPHIQKLRPATGEAFKWMRMIEEIRNRLREFRILLSYRQADKSLLERANQIKAETVELLENYIY